jgi:hypothetical protein
MFALRTLKDLTVSRRARIAKLWPDLEMIKAHQPFEDLEMIRSEVANRNWLRAHDGLFLLMKWALVDTGYGLDRRQ